MGDQQLPEHRCDENYPGLITVCIAEQLCASCRRLAIRPYTAPCGHTFGEVAVNLARTQGITTFNCSCHAQIVVNELSLNAELNETIGESNMMTCPNSNNGCGAVFAVINLDEHLDEECEFRERGPEPSAGAALRTAYNDWRSEWRLPSESRTPVQLQRRDTEIPEQIRTRQRQLSQIDFRNQSEIRQRQERRSQVEHKLNIERKNAELTQAWENYGHTIFKIENFSRKRAKMIEKGKRKGLRGPRFISHESGYLLVPIVFLNGTGNGRGTHLSVFLTVLSGVDDDFLTFPMTASFTFTLLAQDGTSDDIVKGPIRQTYQSHEDDDRTGDLLLGMERAFDFSRLKPPSPYIVDDVVSIKIEAIAEVDDDDAELQALSFSSSDDEDDEPAELPPRPERPYQNRSPFGNLDNVRRRLEF